ncbi:YDG domain-containing protein [Flavobacterium phycosphaerae]|uniref:YDG domain-containing protein n=1 Tax=Flavobacterium phycosphaerae TaxID=2697515 RepID=UPI0013895756|nr:YDG domain-containing protein [Flavobacterium phycosphaerae]
MKNFLLSKKAGSLALWSFALLFLLISGKGYGQISVTTSGVAVTQNFDSMLGTSATAALTTNQWRAGDTASPLTWAGANRTATTQLGGTAAAVSSGGIYNYGDGTAASATDRCVGFLSSGSSPFTATAAAPMHLFAQYVNSTGSTITQLDGTFNVEKYRNGTNASGFSILFYYSTNGTSWTAVTSGNQSFAADANNNAVSPAGSTSKSFSITGLSIASSATFYLRWDYSVTTGSTATNAQGLGIDNVSLTATSVTAVDPNLALAGQTKTYGDSGFTMTATSDNSVGAITYSSNNPSVATINSTTGAVVIKGAGTASILVSQAASTGYTADTASATLTVNPATTGLTITATNISKVYGLALSNGTASVSLSNVSGLLYTDNLGTGATLSYSYGSGGAAFAPVAFYPGDITPSNLILGSGATYNPANYAAVTYVSGDLTVSPASQTITFASTDSKPYGTAAYSLNGIASSGLTVSYSSSDTNVATISGSTITIVGVGTTTITASQAGDGNYNAATSVNQTLTVTAKNLTVTGITANNKNFDGNTDATLSGTGSLVGVVGTDDVTLVGTPVASFLTATVGTGKQVDVTGYSLNGTTAGNYTLTQPTLFADIIANDPTIFVSGTLAAVNATYGSASATPSSFNVSAQSLTDAITVAAPSGFEVSLSSASGYASSILVGGAGSLSSTPIYVRLAATTVAGTYSGDITLNSTGATEVTIATASSTVAPKGLTISGLTGNDKTYDGTTTATVSGTATLNGVVGSDDVTLNSTAVTYNFATATAGASKAITALGFTLNGTAAGNYTVAQPTELSATISKATSTISVTGAFTFTYNGTAQGPNTSSVTGSAGAITYSYNGVSLSYGPSATRPTNVGSYKVVATVAADTNYEAATSADFTFDITKADQTITLASTDTKTTATTTYTLALNASSGLPITYTSPDSSVITISGNTVTIVGAGTATITANQAGNDNYNAAPEATQTLTVTQPACASVSGTTSYNFGAVTPFTASPTATQSNVTTSAVTQGNSFGASTLLSSTSGSSGYTGASGAGNAGIAAVNGAFSTSTSAYFAFTVTPAAGYNFTLNGISFGSRSTTSGPQAYALRSSLDNYATDIATGTLANNSAYALKTNTVSVTGNGNANPVTFRIYGSGGTSTASSGTVNWRIDDLALSLSTSNTPSTATVGANQTVCGLTSAALGGNTPNVGTGTWSQVSGPGTSSFSAVNSGSSTATASVIGTYVYRWSITNGCATSFSADVTVEYKTAATATITAEGATSFCDGGSVTLTANEGASYLWSTNGTSQSITATTSGNYTVTVTAANGCSATSSATTVTVTPNTTHTTTISACDSYTWTAGNGNTYTESGSYTYVNECHTETLALTITPSSTAPDVTASACDSYVWSFNGQTYTASGDYTNTINCVTTTLHLTITPSTSNTTTESVCDSYTWSVNDELYTESGTYTVVSGCHTEILVLTITPTTTHTTTQSACDSFTWTAGNGNTYTESGIYVYVNGCHTETLDLTITPSTSHTTTESACDSFTWTAGNGSTYTESGNYTYVNGCHTETLALTITPSSTHTTTESACDSYTWTAGNGNTYTESGSYVYVNGCHTETLALTITPSTTNTTTASACDTYTWSVNNVEYTVSGNYSVVNGCHTEYLNLTINPGTSHTTTAAACGSYVWSVNGLTYTESGKYTVITGCNEEVLELTITPVTSNTTTATACDSYTWAANEEVYTTSGTYSVVRDCHTEILNLTINTTPTVPGGFNSSYTFCGGSAVPPLDLTALTTPDVTFDITGGSAIGLNDVIGGTGIPTFTAIVGTATITVTPKANGCIGNAVSFTVLVNPSTSNTTTITATGSYTWSVNNITYTATGNYSYTAPNSCHTEYLNLTINSQAEITTQPATTNICGTVGATATFSVASTMPNATYTWQYRVPTATNPNPAWITITSANAAVYSNFDTATLTVTKTSTLPAKGTVYQVLVNGDAPELTSNTAGINILTTVKAGAISVASTNVCLGSDLTMTLTGYAATSFQWQSSPISTGTAPGVFTDIDGATGTSYTLTNAQLNADRSYRVVVVNSCNNTTATTATKTITVNPLSVAGTITVGGGTICEGGSGSLKIAGYVGKIQWEYSEDGVNYFAAPKASAIPVGLPFSTTSTSSTATSYVPTNMTVDLYFRAKVTSGACSSAYTTPVQYIIGTEAIVGTIAGGTTVCPTTGTTLTLSNATGTITWEKSTNYATATPTWTATTNHSLVYPTGNLTLSTAYRVKVTIGSCSTVYSDLAYVLVVAKPLAKTVVANTTSPTGKTALTAICVDSDIKVLTIGAGYNGAIQWQTSTESATTGFSDIAGANQVSYTVTDPVVGVNYFRATFTNSCGTTVNGVAVAVYYKDCTPAKVSTAVPFAVVAYPNPYSDNFHLNLTTSSEERVGVSIYDMTGKLLDKREVGATEASELSIGDRFASGVYNVVVTQGSEVKTLRVVKR